MNAQAPQPRPPGTGGAACAPTKAWRLSVYRSAYSHAGGRDKAFGKEEGMSWGGGGRKAPQPLKTTYVKYVQDDENSPPRIVVKRPAAPSPTPPPKARPQTAWAEIRSDEQAARQALFGTTSTSRRQSRTDE
jgi:hypothetical protein